MKAVLCITLLLVTQFSAFAMGVCSGATSPEISLVELNPGCTLAAVHDGQDRYCTGAMRQFCERVTFSPRIQGIFGVQRENTSESISLSCVEPDHTTFLQLPQLQHYNPDCTVGDTIPCLDAIHQYCVDKFGDGYAGIFSGSNGNSLLVNCFYSPRKEFLHVNVLKDMNSNCVSPDEAAGVHCFSAASRWCGLFGYSGGITQGIRSNEILVACYNANFSGDAFIERTAAFYRAQATIMQVCDLTFQIDQGEILQNVPEVLALETFNNTQSSVPLESNFAFSKDVTTTSSFTSETSVTIGAAVSVEAQLPAIGALGISLSTEVSTGLSLTQENEKTTSYGHESSISVDPGHAVYKTGTIIRTMLDVPWTAKGINGLGAPRSLQGIWRGVDTFNLKISQVDIAGPQGN